MDVDGEGRGWGRRCMVEVGERSSEEGGGGCKLFTLGIQ